MRRSTVQSLSTQLAFPGFITFPVVGSASLQMEFRTFFEKKFEKKKNHFFVSFKKLKKHAKPSQTYWDSPARFLARSGSDNNYKTRQLKYLNLQKNVLKH
jgi:hypothetical protein